MNDVSFEKNQAVAQSVLEMGGATTAMIRETVARFAGESEIAISERIGAIDTEWDIERVLEANSASLALAGLLSAAAGRRRGLVLAGCVAGFLLMHAVRASDLPMGFLRRLGLRTRREIERERFVLKYLRGDFAGLTTETARRNPAELLAAVAI